MAKNSWFIFPKQALPKDFDYFDLKTPILEKLQSFSLQNAYSKPIFTMNLHKDA